MAPNSSASELWVIVHLKIFPSKKYIPYWKKDIHLSGKLVEPGVVLLLLLGAPRRPSLYTLHAIVYCLSFLYTLEIIVYYLCFFLMLWRKFFFYNFGENNLWFMSSFPLFKNILFLFFSQGQGQRVKWLLESPEFKNCFFFWLFFWLLVV